MNIVVQLLLIFLIITTAIVVIIGYGLLSMILLALLEKSQSFIKNVTPYVLFGGLCLLIYGIYMSINYIWSM
jgi:hypothetical protein